SPSLCWITVTRLPLAEIIDHFTPTPGRRVSFNSTGIDPPWNLSHSQAAAETGASSWLRGRGHKGPPDPLRLLHQQPAHRRRDEDVEPGKGGDVVPVRRC